MRWEWDERARRFRDIENGRFLSARDVFRLREEFVDFRVKENRVFIQTLVDRAAETGSWDGVLRDLDRLGWRRAESTMIAEYVYGRGGINAMTDADKAELRQLLNGQRQYWDGFMADLRDDPDKRTVDYISRRAGAYHQSSRGFFERGQAAAWNIRLPTYPGEQECRYHCKCTWRIRETADAIEATWILGDAQHCGDCDENAREYDPLRFDKPKTEDEAA